MSSFWTTDNLDYKAEQIKFRDAAFRVECSVSLLRTLINVMPFKEAVSCSKLYQNKNTQIALVYH